MVTENIDYDPLRHSFIRYLGYANEVGESFKSMIPKWAYLSSYVVSGLYVTADSIDKGSAEYKV